MKHKEKKKLHTLMLPLAHDINRQRTQHKQIDQPRHRNGGHGQHGVKSVFGSSEPRQTQCLATFAGSQCHCHRQSGLQGEVDGEDGRLQTGELRARQSAEGDNAADKGLRKGQM